MKGINHIGIAVSSIEKALPFYVKVLGLSCSRIEEVPAERVRIAFIDAQNVKIELLEATDNESAIHKFIERHGEGIHHIAMSVDGIEDRIVDLKAKGVRMLQDEPKIGAGGAQIAFMHPTSAHGVLYELWEMKPGNEVGEGD